MSLLELQSLEVEPMEEAEVAATIGHLCFTTTTI